MNVVGLTIRELLRDGVLKDPVTDKVIFSSIKDTPKEFLDGVFISNIRVDLQNGNQTYLKFEPIEKVKVTKKVN